MEIGMCAELTSVTGLLSFLYFLINPSRATSNVHKPRLNSYARAQIKNSLLCKIKVFFYFCALLN